MTRRSAMMRLFRSVHHPRMETNPIRKAKATANIQENMAFNIRVVATNPSVYCWTPTSVQRLHERQPAYVRAFAPRGFTAGNETHAAGPPATRWKHRGGRTDRLPRHLFGEWSSIGLAF